MIADKSYASKNRKANRNEDPIGQFVPVLILNIVECLLVNQFPSSENIYFMCPDCANVAEAKSKIKKKKYFFWAHEQIVNQHRLLCNLQGFSLLPLLLGIC
jgi:hypothetical protein